MLKMSCGTIPNNCRNLVTYRYDAYHIVQSDRIARQVTVLARQQSYTVLALLAHIAWHFDSQYGLPKGIVGRSPEYQSPPEVFGFFQDFEKSRSLPERMCCYLFEKSELMEWAGAGSPEMLNRKVMSERKVVFKRRVEDIIWSLGSSLLLALKIADGNNSG